MNVDRPKFTVASNVVSVGASELEHAAAAWAFPAGTVMAPWWHRRAVDRAGRVIVNALPTPSSSRWAQLKKFSVREADAPRPVDVHGGSRRRGERRGGEPSKRAATA
jgi:hypothetical protein